MLPRSNESRIRFAVLAAVLAGIGGLTHTASAAPTVYLDDTFSDNERFTESLPSSGRWTVGAHRGSDAFGTLDASAGNLVLDHTRSSGVNSYAAVWSHFAPSGSPVTLDIGETMTLSFDVSFSGGQFSASAAGFRFALLNSGGNRVTTDFAGNNTAGVSSGTTFSLWRGYKAETPASATLFGAAGSADFLTRERTGSGDGLFTGTNWTSLAGGAAIEPLLAANTVYNGSLVLSRTAAGMFVQANFAGASTPVALDATPVTSFDTVAFFVIDGVSHNITFDNIRVAVPEPTTAALACVAGIALLGRRRRA